MSRRGAIHLLAVGTALVLTMVLPSQLRAQVCFRGQPKPRCEGFWIVEFTAGARLNQKNSFGPGQSPVYAAWSLGYMQNLGPRSALGAAFKVSADDDGSFYGPVLRYRQWLDSSWSLDLAPGLLLGGNRNLSQPRFPSLTADAALNWGDRVGVLVGLDAIRDGSGKTSWEGHAGLRLGTWLAPIATLGLAVLAGATYN